MKKLLALALALCMMLGMVSVAGAEILDERHGRDLHLHLPAVL